MVVMYKPQGDPSAMYFAPSHSLLYRFPEIVYGTYLNVCDKNSKIGVMLREDFGLSNEEIDSVLDFFEKYFKTLLEQKSDPDPYTAFKNAGLPELADREPKVFYAVFSVIGVITLSMYHGILVETKGEANEKYIPIKQVCDALSARNQGINGQQPQDGVAGA